MRTFTAGLLITLTSYTYAQESDTVVLTLDECIQTALDKNIGIQIAENNARIAKSDKIRAMMTFMPSIQAQWNFNMLFGTFWDNIAARQVTQQNSSNPNIGSSLVLFNGFRQINGLKGSEYAYESAKYGIEDSKLSTKTNVLSAYLATIIDRENIKISENRLELLQNQLDREIKRESVGVGNLETVFNFKSQVANERLTLTNLRNQYRSDLLNLLQILRVDVSKTYDISEFDISEEELLTEMNPFSDILEESFQYAPSVKSSEASKMASVYTYKASKATLLPTVSIYGEIGSRYSSQGAANPDNDFQPEKAPYLDQMQWNEYEFIGVSVSIPIFNRYQTRNAIETAKLNMLNSELANEQAKQDLTNTVQQVYLDLVSSQESYRTATENLEALKQSFEFVKKRYETGNTDFYTYLESLNNKNRAELELINAKFSIVFRKKILSLYMGS